MKKIYSTPQSIKIELSSEPLMNVTSGEQTGAGVGNGNAGNNTPDLSGKRRAEWGNLWK